MTDHTPISQVSRLEVISTGARRRWTLAEKQRIVAESYSAPRVVSATARRNGLSASQLFTWRRLARAGRLIEVEEAATFAPAIISREAPSTSSPSFPERVEGRENLPHSPCPVGVASRIEIVLACGRRVVVDNGVDSAALARDCPELIGAIRKKLGGRHRLDDGFEIAPEPAGHGLPLSKCEAYNRVYEQPCGSS
jgi:transposase